MSNRSNDFYDGIQAALSALGHAHKQFKLEYHNGQDLRSVNFSLDNLIEINQHPTDSTYEYWFAMFNEVEKIASLKVGEFLIFQLSRDVPEDGQGVIWRMF